MTKLVLSPMRPAARDAVPSRRPAAARGAVSVGPAAVAAGDAARGSGWWMRVAEALAPPLVEGQCPQRDLWVV